MALIAFLAILSSFFASPVAAHLAQRNSGTPFFATATIGGVFGNATAFAGTATPLGSIFGTHTSFGPSPTGSFNNSVDAVNNTTNNVGKTVAITVGIILGCYFILFGIVLGVFVTRRRNRKAWYGPMAEFYRKGGRMGDVVDFHAGQPLLGAAKSFVSTSSPAPSSTLYPALPYQQSPSPSIQYDSEVNYGHGTPSPIYQQPPMGQFDPNPGYGQPYPQYNEPMTSAPHTGSPNLVIQV